MKKTALSLLFIALAAVCWGQATYNLPDSNCAIQAESNLFCNDMGAIVVNGVTYEVNSLTIIPNLYQYPATGTITSGDISIENLSTDIYTTGYDNSTSTYENYVLTQNFSGALNGTLKFTLLREHSPRCTRYCYLWFYFAHNVTLTLE